ncbi:acyl-protein thioesterase [Xylariaceae sp. FL0662B]|nr:acyl-protein thioesterase [Xylariaceae sp. FL0662B]
MGSHNNTKRSHLPFIVEPTSHHTHSFILLHGLGSNGHKFGQELLETGICSDGRKLNEIFRGARFIFPTAKRRRSSAFNRTKLTQWFDIASLDDVAYRQNTQLEGLAESAREILDLIRDEAQKIPPKNIIIGGISLGCAMALSCLLAIDVPIGGFIGMSGWLPFRADIEEVFRGGDEAGVEENPFGFDDDDPFSTSDEQTHAEQDPTVKVVKFVRDLLCLDDLDNPTQDLPVASLSTPIFLGHGDADEKVKPSLGEAAYKTLDLIGYNVTWKSYKEQGHWYKIPDEIDDMLEFVKDKVGWEFIPLPSSVEISDASPN